MADLTFEVAQSHAAAPHQTGHSRQERLQSVAKFVDILKYDPNEPRNPKGSGSVGGRWVSSGQGTEHLVPANAVVDEPTVGRTFTSEEGYQWHEKGPVAEWAKALPYEYVRAIDSYSGFGYHDVNDLRRGNYQPPIIDHFVRAATPEEMRRIGWDPDKKEWIPAIKVKEGEYKAGHPIDPRDEVTPEYIARFGHPMVKRYAKDYAPDEPYHQVEDGRIVVNSGYRPVEGGPEVFISIQRAGPDLERLATVKNEANKLDDLIAHHGYVLPESITVERGAYLPGVTFEQLQNMQYEGPHGEPPAVHEEKGFTSTMVGEAGGRAKSYPALGKFESLHNRFGDKAKDHEDEVGTAVRFHITLPTGTKVASVEAVRRLSHDFPQIPDPAPRPPDVEPKYWVKRDYTATPTVNAKDLEAGKEGRRIESEVLLGSGAKFRVVKTDPGYVYRTSDMHDIPVREVYLEYIGGGSSDGRK